MTSQITSLTSVYSTVYSGADKRKHQSSAWLAFVWGIHRWPANYTHKWPVTQTFFPFDEVIMIWPWSLLLWDWGGVSLHIPSDFCKVLDWRMVCLWWSVNNVSENRWDLIYLLPQNTSNDVVSCLILENGIPQKKNHLGSFHSIMKHPLKHYNWGVSVNSYILSKDIHQWTGSWFGTYLYKTKAMLTYNSELLFSNRQRVHPNNFKYIV